MKSALKVGEMDLPKEVLSFMDTIVNNALKPMLFIHFVAAFNPRHLRKDNPCRILGNT